MKYDRMGARIQQISIYFIVRKDTGGLGMKFKNIRKILKRDWQSIVRNPVAIVIVAGVCLLPSLYAWVNIKACWNVYENTSTIPVAVVNNDTPATLRDKEIHIGNDVVEELKQNDKIDWQFVSEKQADLGLADGTYFAAIILPEDFSENFTTLLSGKPVKPKIIYKVDTKVNPVAVKITESAKNTLVETITTNFVSTVNESIFALLNPVGEDADANLQDVLKMKDAIVSLNQNMGLVTTSLDALHDNSQNLNQFLTGINATWPMVENSLNHANTRAVSRQELSRSTQERLNASLNYMDTNLNYIQTSNERTHALLTELTDAANQGNTAKMNTTFQNLDTLLDSMDTSIGATATYLRQYKKMDWASDAENAADKLTSLRASLTDMRTQLVQLQENLKKLSGDSKAFYDYLDKAVPALEQNLTNLDASISSTIASLESLNSVLQSKQIDDLIQGLKELQQSNSKDAILAPLKTLQSTRKGTEEFIQSAYATAGSTIKLIDQAVPKIDATVKYLNSVQNSDDEKKEELGKMIGALDMIQNDVASVQTQLKGIRPEANAATSVTKEKTDTLQKDLYEMESRFNAVLTDYNKSIRGDISTIGTQLVSSADGAAALTASAQTLGSEISGMLQTAQEGAVLTTEFTSKLSRKLNDFEDVIEVLGGKLELVNNNDVVQIISILQSNPEFMGSFISSPFEQKTESVYPIPNYGSSMAPIYTTLALWVGCLILNSLMKTEVKYFEGLETFTLREKHFGKLLTFCSMAVVQGLIVSLGNIFLLKIHVVNPFLFVCVAVFSSLVFCIITYTLYSTLGNAGKAIAIVYMIFQLAGSGGSYPIQVDPTFFRVLQPLFPFAYTVGGFREAIAGPLVSAVLLDFVVLGLFAFVFLFSGYYLINRLHPRVHRFEKTFEISGLGE